MGDWGAWLCGKISSSRPVSLLGCDKLEKERNSPAAAKSSAAAKKTGKESSSSANRTSDLTGCEKCDREGACWSSETGKGVDLSHPGASPVHQKESPPPMNQKPMTNYIRQQFVYSRPSSVLLADTLVPSSGPHVSSFEQRPAMKSSTSNIAEDINELKEELAALQLEIMAGTKRMREAGDTDIERAKLITWELDQLQGKAAHMRELLESASLANIPLTPPIGATPGQPTKARAPQAVEPVARTGHWSSHNHTR